MRAALFISFMVFCLCDPSIARAESTLEPGALQTVIDQERDFYNAHFKEIQFVFLEGGTHWEEDIGVLALLLGHQPGNLNYQHPPELRQELMDASVSVLIHMLRAQEPYSVLFRADTPLGWRENLCIISLDPHRLAVTDQAASGFLFDLEPDQVAAIPDHKRLPSHEFLHYLIDHEAFHCLDALYNGPQPMSDKELWGQYYNFRRENGADAYALAMNIQRRGAMGDFPRLIQDFRGMRVFQGDPDHWSYDAISRLLLLPASEIARQTPGQLFLMASRIRDEVVKDYVSYLRYSATAAHAFLQMHRPVSDAGTRLSDTVDPSLLERLLTITDRIRQQNPHLAE